jgi:TPR repeat protein
MKQIFAICVAMGVFALPAGPAAAQSSAPVTTDINPIGPDVMQAMRDGISGKATGRAKLEELAGAGRADAQEALAEMLLMGGFGGPPEPVLACRYFEKASPTRSDSLHSFAFCTEKGIGGAPDLVRAADLYRQAGEKGFAKSKCALGNLYMNGKGVTKDVKRGAALCLEGAKAGDADAQTDVGNMYLTGDGVEHDMVQARLWYEKAAAQDQPNAEFVLGQIYWNGDGVQKDRGKAAELWQKAYDRGRSDAAILLGRWAFAQWMAEHPVGDQTLLDKAIQWDEAAVKAASNDQEKKDATEALTLAQAIKAAAKSKSL